ncbi:MAG TPA: TetR/AcrR family transcriptional regulator [Burkholderiales bacterium]|nr:TetR/AcrR family transcriptional regulator [Burkholderiales bacterium]
MPRTSDKRGRLVKAGRRLIHSKGFGATTLSDIADASGVPLGNVYYYFRTKEDLLDAVLEKQEDDFRARVARFDNEPTPQARLLAFLDSVIESRISIARHGCPVGSLSQEMNKRGGASRSKVNQGLILRAQWVSDQFREMGRTDAQELGVWLTGSVQGVILMANALDDPEVIERQISQLKAWVQAF